MNPVVLIVDDEKNTRDGLFRALRKNYKVLLAEQSSRALEILNKHTIDLVLSDIRMPGMDGIQLMKEMLKHEPPPTVLLMTAYGSVEMAVEAMKLGAYDFLTKPVNLDRLEMLVERALKEKQIKAQNLNLQQQLNTKYQLDNIIGNSPSMREIFDIIRQVAPTRATALIQGESGTGKELVAQAIHRLSPRADKPFIAAHCAALSETLLESELFGYEKGAFTGATENRKGRFERADGGTLFLDEIGEINTSTQVKILRVLEERNFERVGGQETIETNVRMLTATNKNLKKLVEEGLFRKDLFFRLNVVIINLPPLRERLEDIPLLAQHFIKELAIENELPDIRIAPEAMEALTHYSWPGNIRELRNVLERMIVMSTSKLLNLQDVPQEILNAADESEVSLMTGNVSLGRAEKSLILQTLKKYGGNKTKTAEALGISRRTLHRKLSEYGK